jgi:hypothetical protein
MDNVFAVSTPQRCQTAKTVELGNIALNETPSDTEKGVLTGFLPTCFLEIIHKAPNGYPSYRTPWPVFVAWLRLS